MAGEVPTEVSWSWRRAWLFGAAGDAVRAVWAAFYWNGRKTWYVMTGRKGAAPCQHAHDLADGLKPRCEAVWHWSGPGRFRRVCPALAYTKDGWRCSAKPAQVKPYWGRAAALYALLAAVLYLGAAGALWGLWQTVGYREISYADMVWPGRWSRVTEARAGYFREQGGLAVARGDFPGALLALSTAERFRRGDQGQRLLLARLWAQAGNTGYAEGIFRDLMAEYPQRAEEIAVVWHDQLLAAGELAALADLCAQRLGERGEGARESLWEFSLGFALDRGRLAEAMAAGRSAALAKLPVRMRELVAVLVLWQRGEGTEAAGRLRALRFEADEPLALRRQVEWLARLGAGDEAGVVLNRHAGALGGFEAAALRYHIDMVSGSRDAARADFVGLLRGELTPAQADRLCGLVIAERDGRSLRRTPGFFALAPLNADPNSQAAFWVAALACESPELAEGGRLRYEAAAGGASLPTITRIDFSKQNPAERTSPVFVASYVPLPRETIYALIGEMADERMR